MHQGAKLIYTVMIMESSCIESIALNSGSIKVMCDILLYKVETMTFTNYTIWRLCFLSKVDALSLTNLPTMVLITPQRGASQPYSYCSVLEN